jgi:hypothetical protein
MSITPCPRKRAQRPPIEPKPVVNKPSRSAGTRGNQPRAGDKKQRAGQLAPGGGSLLRERRHAARQKWETIRYAIDDTGRTIRLCFILAVLAVCTAVVPVSIALLHVHLG